MSAIASFYLIPDEKRDEIVCAAEAQSAAMKKKRFGFLPPKFPLNPDPFWDFVSRNTEELQPYPYSGFFLSDLELLARDCLGSDDSVGARLSHITHSTFISFRPQEAAKAIGILETADFSDAAIKSFLAEEGRDGGDPDSVLAIQSAAQHLKNWLNSIPIGKTGLLSIG